VVNRRPMPVHVECGQPVNGCMSAGQSAAPTPVRTLRGDQCRFGIPYIALTVDAEPDIPLFDLELAPEDIEAVTRTLRSGWLTMGPRIQALESAFSEHLGVRHAIAVTNGTAALHLAYRSAGVGRGDEVIVPSFTFVATANAAFYCGAEPVFADIEGLANPSIDPLEVERRITPRTKAVCAVHFAGYAAAVDALAQLCDDRGLVLIEDAAHAPSATLGGRKLGTFGRAGAFSFFSNKVLAIGEGGLVVTDDDDVAERVRQLRSHAMTSMTWDRHRGHADSYDVVDIGFNYRMDEPRAALALSRLARMESEIVRRRELTHRYRERLRGQPELILPYADEEVDRSSCYVMPLMLRDPARRPAVRRALRDQFGIQTSILYPAIHEFSAYRERMPGIVLPRTERAAMSELTIPLYPQMTERQQDRVIDALKTALMP
jgi:dTDP-4-amino-4,6-dideoxygalactose transaminase